MVQRTNIDFKYLHLLHAQFGYVILCFLVSGSNVVVGVLLDPASATLSLSLVLLLVTFVGIVVYCKPMVVVTVWASNLLLSISGTCGYKLTE